MSVALREKAEAVYPHREDCLDLSRSRPFTACTCDMEPLQLAFLAGYAQGARERQEAIYAHGQSMMGDLDIDDTAWAERMDTALSDPDFPWPAPPDETPPEAAK